MEKMNNNKREFKVADKNYYVVMPSPKQERDSQIVYAKALTSAIKSGILCKDSIDTWLRTQGIWSDEKESKKFELQLFLATGQNMLETKRDKDGKNMKKSDARKLALEMNDKRMELLKLLSETGKYSEYTAEGMAENDKFVYLVSVCTKNEDGTKTFSSVEDLYEKEETELAQTAQNEFAIIFSGFNPDFYKDFPENKFLIEHGFVNDKLQLIDKEGNNVDEEGNKLKEEEAAPIFTDFLDE